MTNQPLDPARRQFLRSSFAAGAWTLAATVLPAGLAGAAEEMPADPFGMWLVLTADGMVAARTTVSNLGQGTHGAIVQLVAEELAIGLDKVSLRYVPVERRFEQDFPPGITTFASAGFAAARRTVGMACAAARDMLLRAAAAQWQLDAAACEARDGAVMHRASGRVLPYGALLEAAARLAPPAKPTLKPVSQWSVLGRSVPRADVPARVDGSAVYGIDVAPPGVLTACVLHAPGFGGALLEVDPAPALAVRGVRQVIALARTVAVVADGYWPAHKACMLLKPVWQLGPHGALDSETMRQAMRQAVQAGKGRLFPSGPGALAEQEAAAAAAAMARAAQLIDTVYEVPFLAHAAMEPLNATVAVSASGAQVWLSTQSQTDTQHAVAKALGMRIDQVTIHSQDAGGGFGRRLEHDFAVEAALIAEAAGATVKTIWSREADMQSGYYRPAATARVRLALDAAHGPLALRADMAGPSLLEYTGASNGPAVKGFDWSYVMGWLGVAYTLPLRDTRWTRVDHGVPCGYWRSVGNAHNCFFLEHTIEQAARAAGQDAVAYRLRLMDKDTKGRAFLEALAARAQWSAPLPEGHFRGVAINRTAGRTYGGHVVELAVLAPGRFKLVRITAAIDPGAVANPDAVQAQMMGGTLFGLSAVLFGEITLAGGQVEQGNFDSYRVVKLADLALLDVLVISSGDQSFGVGEEGPPSIMAAVANALLAAGGKPITRLPVARSGWQLAA